MVKVFKIEETVTKTVAVDFGNNPVPKNIDKTIGKILSDSSMSKVNVSCIDEQESFYPKYEFNPKYRFIPCNNGLLRL